MTTASDDSNGPPRVPPEEYRGQGEAPAEPEATPAEPEATLIESATVPAEPVAAPDGPAAAPAGRARQHWQAWRQWRRSRPFWGGLLVILGGAEILLSEKAPLPVIIHVGLQGLAGYLIPAVMVLCGLLLLFHPQQQTFYSILAVLLSLATWITSNLGGFFIGMLLGVIGGSLAFAWQRGRQASAKRRRRLRPPREPSAGLAIIGGEPPADAGPGGPRDSTGPGDNLRSAIAILALPLAPLALAVIAGPAPVSPAASPSRGPAISASPSTAPSPIASPTYSVTPTPSPAPTPSPSAVPSPRATRKHPRAAGAPVARAATALSTLTAGSAVLTGLSFDGVAQVPTAAGPVPMLKFSMVSLRLSAGAKLLVSQGGQAALAATAPLLQFSGDVVLFTTKISGSLAGKQVTFTPQQPPSGLGPDVTLSGVVVHQPYASTGSLQAPGLCEC